MPTALYGWGYFVSRISPIWLRLLRLPTVRVTRRSLPRGDVADDELRLYYTETFVMVGDGTDSGRSPTRCFIKSHNGINGSGISRKRTDAYLSYCFLLCSDSKGVEAELEALGMLPGLHARQLVPSPATLMTASWLDMVQA